MRLLRLTRGIKLGDGILKKVIAIAAVAAFLGACATTAGNDQVNDFARYQALQPGETTKAQVFDAFGQPYDVTYEADSSSKWTYYMTTLRMNPMTVIPFVGLVAGGSDVDARISNFWFDPAGAYLRNESRTKSAYMNMWAGMATIANANDEAKRAKSEMNKLGLPFDEKKANWMSGMADILGEKTGAASASVTPK